MVLKARLGVKKGKYLVPYPQISTTSSPPSALAAPLHQILSSLPSPTSSLLSIVWISTDPSLEMEPSLFGALQRLNS